MSTAYSSAFRSGWPSPVVTSPQHRYVQELHTTSSPARSRSPDGLNPLDTILEDRSYQGGHIVSDPADLPKIHEDDVLIEPAPQLVYAANYSTQNSTNSCTARQRLLTRLEFYGLVERAVKGDGNCQFRALSDQLYGTPSYYKELRNVAIHQLRRHQLKYQGFISEDICTYIEKLRHSGTWGDHVTLQAIADWFGVKIYVVTSFLEKCVVVVRPEKEKTNRVLWLSFWAEVHYNSLYPESEPPKDIPREKVLGSKKIARLLHDEWMVM